MKKENVTQTNRYQQITAPNKETEEQTSRSLKHQKMGEILKRDILKELGIERVI